ncbi:MAG: PilZ domain-containing protein [Deltaproteobacteria bacterium]|nr:PilZ domain-containing protein [Deltaproteobacteria bacterium]
MISNNKRSHFRVEILVPARWEILNQQELDLVKKGLAPDIFKADSFLSPIDEILVQTPPGSVEEQLYNCLQFLNNKLDFIIEHLLPDSMKGMNRQGEVIEISASGLKFSCKENLGTGILLKMNLILSGSFKYQMNFIAEVMRVEKRDGKFIIAARFAHINSDDRDSIVKAVFKKHRLDIRAKKDK